MASRLRGWLRWLVALLGHIAELHPGVVTFGTGAPPSELPRRPAQVPPPAPRHMPTQGGTVPREPAPAQASTQRQVGSERARYRRVRTD